MDFFGLFGVFERHIIHFIYQNNSKYELYFGIVAGAHHGRCRSDTKYSNSVYMFISPTNIDFDDDSGTLPCPAHAGLPAPTKMGDFDFFNFIL